MTTEIYLDGNATTAVLPAAIDAAARAMGEGFGNPSSTHATGLRARAMMEAVRRRAARLLGVGGGRLMFNSGATEGIQTAVLSALCALRERRAGGAPVGRWLLYGATEHKAVPESLAHWNRLLGLGLELKALPVDQDGRHDLAALRALAGETAFLCTMAANNETGVISDLPGIGRVLAETGCAALWMVDGVQALGKLALDLAATRIDYAPFSGHKLYAPKGVGLLYVRAGAPFTPLMMGGGQESGWRSGTENMAAIAALGAVLAALEDGVTFRDHATLSAYRDRLADSLRAALPGVAFNTPFALALPTTLNFAVPGVAARELLDVFDAAGVRVSAGSACSAAKAAPSHVLEAMGLPAWRSAAAVRLSFGPLADAAVIDAACERIARCGAALRGAGLLGPAQPAPARDDLIQFAADGASSWLLTDAASRCGVVIDPSDAVRERLVGFLRGHGYALRAILSTVPGAAADAAGRRLAQALGSDCAPGWPSHAQSGADALPAPWSGRSPDARSCPSSEPSPEAWADASSDQPWQQSPDALRLGDGGAVRALRIGRHSLARWPQADGRVLYLLGRARAGRLAPDALRAAFTGTLPAAALDAAVLGPDTVLCPGGAGRALPCTTLRAERAAAPADADSALQLDAAALAALLRAHPDALLVDVREAYEQAVGAVAAPDGRAPLAVPLSRFGHALGDWLRGPRPPLVFFCRSGNRSHQAASCLRRLGYGQAWHVGGGVALGGAALAG